MAHEGEKVVVTEVLPRSLESVPVDGALADEWLERRYDLDGEQIVRLNMITTVTGSIAGADGTSDSITSPTDRRVLRAIRRQADVVLVGAQTVRAERYVMPRDARLAIVTATGDLGESRVTSSDPGRPALVLHPASRRSGVAAALDGTDVVLVPIPDDDGRVRAADLLAALFERRLTRVVCEGGPALATMMLAQNALDEICLTVAPVLDSPGTPFVSPISRVDTALAGMLVDTRGFSYLRLRLRDRGGVPTP